MFRVLRFPLIPYLTLLTSPTHLTQQTTLNLLLFPLKPTLPPSYTPNHNLNGVTVFYHGPSTPPPPLPPRRHRRHLLCPHLHHAEAHRLCQQPLRQLPRPPRARLLPPLDPRRRQRLPLGGLPRGAAEPRRVGLLGD